MSDDKRQKELEKDAKKKLKEQLNLLN